MKVRVIENKFDFSSVTEGEEYNVVSTHAGGYYIETNIPNHQVFMWTGEVEEVKEEEKFMKKVGQKYRVIKDNTIIHEPMEAGTIVTLVKIEKDGISYYVDDKGIERLFIDADKSNPDVELYVEGETAMTNKEDAPAAPYKVYLNQNKKTTRVKFPNGEEVVVTRDASDKHDHTKAMLYALGKLHFGSYKKLQEYLETPITASKGKKLSNEVVQPSRKYEGKQYRVINNNTNHGFEIGSIVTLVEIDGKMSLYENSEGVDKWLRDIDHVEPSVEEL